MSDLVLGIGNDIKRDDAVGLRLTEDLEARVDAPDVDFRTMTSGRIMLIDEMSGYDRVFIVDSIKTEGGTPGDWYRFCPDEVEPGDESGGLATHNVGLGTLTTLGEAMGESMPEVTIFAVEVAEPFEYGEEMTDAVAEALPGLVEAIGAELADELGVEFD
ncbi:MAG: hydrogenase maturation protease [Haloarculaceae archaeon]